MWPRLPSWFWAPAGIWETIAGCLLFLGEEYLDVALGLLFTFMGGILSSVVYIKDENGLTHFSGKGKLGPAEAFHFEGTLEVHTVYYSVSVKAHQMRSSRLRWKL
eukprot:scaffold2192_cov268-Chaetoceros_neogracile.AAC.20